MASHHGEICIVASFPPHAPPAMRTSRLVLVSLSCIHAALVLLSSCCTECVANIAGCTTPDSCRRKTGPRSLRAGPVLLFSQLRWRCCTGYPDICSLRRGVILPKGKHCSSSLPKMESEGRCLLLRRRQRMSRCTFQGRAGLSNICGDEKVGD